MLSLFRQKKEWLRWVLLFGIIAIGLTTVLLFVNTPSGMRAGIGVQEVAVVAGRPITAAEFGRYYRRLLDTYRELYNLDRQDPEIVRQLGIGQQALNQLIRQYAAQHAAEGMGLDISTEELVSQISRLFQEGGTFIGTERYLNILHSNNLTAKDFEASMRRDLLAEKLQNILTDGVIAPSGEVRQNFLDSNQEVAVRYVLFDPEKIQQEPVTEERIKEYFEEHLEEFREPEKRRISYANVFIPPTVVEVTEEQIQAELPSVPADEQVRARHILIRVAGPADEEAAKKKADELVRRLRAGAGFEELAKEHSDDTATALEGGDLGFFGRGQMVPEFERVAFSQAENQISDPVRSPFGFHIIQTLNRSGSDDVTRRSAAEFNAKLKESARRSRETADQLVAEVRAGTTLEDAAAKFSISVAQSPLFDSIQGVPALGAGRDFTDQIFSLSQGETTAPVEAGGRFVVGRVDEIVPARLPEFTEVRDDIVERMRSEQGNQMARERAEGFFKAAEQAESFEAAARAASLQVVTTGLFRKGTNVDDNLRFSPDLHEQAFTLGVGEIGTPVLVAGKYIVFQVAEKSAVDELQFAREKKEIETRLTEQKRAEFFGAYLQNVVDELRRQEQIVVNQQLLDDLIG